MSVRRLGALAVLASSFAAGIFACGDDDVAVTEKDAGGDATVDTGGGDSGGDAGLTPLDCEVAIVGAGPGGLHTAYKLTNPPSGTTVTGLTAGSGVCVFEKNDRIGGRIRDLQVGPNADDLYGTGGYRLYKGQY